MSAVTPPVHVQLPQLKYLPVRLCDRRRHLSCLRPDSKLQYEIRNQLEAMIPVLPIIFSDPFHRVHCCTRYKAGMFEYMNVGGLSLDVPKSSSRASQINDVFTRRERPLTTVYFAICAMFGVHGHPR